MPAEPLRGVGLLAADAPESRIALVGEAERAPVAVPASLLLTLAGAALIARKAGRKGKRPGGEL